MFAGNRIEKWLKILIFAGLLVLVVMVFSQRIELASSDLGRHLENGKIIWQNQQVLFKNLYSYSEPDTQFVNHHWLAGVIYYAVFLLGGFKLLSLLNIFLMIAAFILAFKIAQKKAGFYISALLALPVIFLLGERVEVRPEIFSYLFIVLTWFILERSDERKNYRLLFWLIPLFLVWVNIHSYFLIGLILVGFKFGAEFLPIFLDASGTFKNRFKIAWLKTRIWLKYLGASILVCLLNPNFVKSLLYPFNFFKKYGYEVAENKSVFSLGHLMVNYNITLFEEMLFLLFFSLAASLFFYKRIRWFELFSSLFFSFLALSAARNLSLFGLVSLILISANLFYPFDFLKNNVFYFRHELREKYRASFLVFILVLVFVEIIYLGIDARKTNNFIKNSPGWGLSQGSEDSIKFFRDNNLSGPIFNNYDLGSALIFWLYPKEKVFVDNRPEAYSNGFFSDIYRPMQLDREKWLEYSARYQFKTIYISHTDFTPWAQTFLGKTIDANWALVYFDRYTVIFLNKEKYDRETINRLTLDKQAIRNRLRSLAASSDLKTKLQLAFFANLIHQPDLSEEIYREIIFSNPGNGLALSSLGAVYAKGEDRNTLSEALFYFQESLKAGYRLPGVYNQIAMVNWRLGDYQKAEAAWHSALKLEKKNALALYYLEQIRQLRLQGVIK